MKFANGKRKNGSKGVDLEGEVWLYEELCQHKYLSQEVAKDLAVLLGHSLPKDNQIIEKILLILQEGLENINEEDQHADVNRKAVIKLIKELVKRLIDNAALGRLSIRERVAILHPAAGDPCTDHAGIDKDLVYESLENDITGGSNDQMIVDLLCLIDDSVEEEEHLGQLTALALRRLSMTRAAVLLSSDPRPTAEWLVAKIRAFFAEQVSQAGFEEVVQLLRHNELQVLDALDALNVVLDRLDALLESAGRTDQQNEQAEEVLKDHTIIIPRAWATAARHLGQDHIVSLLQDHIVSLPAGSLDVGVQLELVHKLNSLEGVYSVLEADAMEEMDPDCPLAKNLLERGEELEEQDEEEAE